MRNAFILLPLMLALSLLACGGGPTPDDEGQLIIGDPAAGKALFAQSLIDTQPGCVTCHSVDPNVTVLGPSLAGIGMEAAWRVEEMSDEDYLRQSIMEPDVYVVEGFSHGLMPKALANVLSEQQIADLVAYLLTLE
jgi:mono/diheme cytochrome c family protein